MRLDVPAGALTDSCEFSVSPSPTPPIPTDLVAVGAAVDVAVSDAGVLEAGVDLGLPVDPLLHDAQKDTFILHLDAAGQVDVLPATQPTVESTDYHARTRSFSTYVPVQVSPLAPPPETRFTAFVPSQDGWGIENPSSDLASSTVNGACVGMCAFAVWYFRTSAPTDSPLAVAFAGVPNMQTPIGTARLSGGCSGGVPVTGEYLLALRAQIAQRAIGAGDLFALLPERLSVAAAELSIRLDTPALLLIGPGTADAGLTHAVVAYGYEVNPMDGSVTFHIYDPNAPGRDDLTALWSATTGFQYDASYCGGLRTKAYRRIAFTSSALWGPSQYFSEILTDALSGFLQSPDLTVSDRSSEVESGTGENWITLSGTVGGAIVDPKLWAFDGLGRRAIALNGPSFEVQVATSTTESRLVAIAAVSTGEERKSTAAMRSGLVLRTIPPRHPVLVGAPFDVAWAASDGHGVPYVCSSTRDRYSIQWSADGAAGATQTFWNSDCDGTVFPSSIKTGVFAVEWRFVESDLILDEGSGSRRVAGSYWDYLNTPISGDRSLGSYLSNGQLYLRYRVSPDGTKLQRVHVSVGVLDTFRR